METEVTLNFGMVVFKKKKTPGKNVKLVNRRSESQFIYFT